MEGTRGAVCCSNRGQMKGHKDLQPEVGEDEATAERQRQERKSHTEDHGGPRPPPQVRIEVGEKEEKEEDHMQKPDSDDTVPHYSPVDWVLLCVCVCGRGGGGSPLHRIRCPGNGRILLHSTRQGPKCRGSASCHAL